MKIKIEYNLPGDERKFLNFWNSINGDDVTVEIKNDKLYLDQDDDNSDELPEKEITYKEYFELVEKSFVNSLKLI